MELRSYFAPRDRLTVSLAAGAFAVTLNIAALQLADVVSLPTPHGGLLRLTVSWLARPLSAFHVDFVWSRVGLPPPSSPIFQTGFHVAVALAMAVLYAFVVEPLLHGRALTKGVAYAACVWLLNAAVVLPLNGEGFAGSADRPLAGLIWFAAAHLLFFASLSFVYEVLR